MNLGLRGKVALVTGGSHGIGLATAVALAGEACDVAICARNAERLASAAKEIESRGVKSVAVQADALVPSDIERVMKTVIDSWSTIHILVNNVGGGGRWGTPSVEETSEKVWLDVYAKNTLAAIRFTKLAIPFMKRQQWGRVVTVSSTQGKEGGGRPWYTTAKSAEISLMKTLAMDESLVRSGITFNSVAPGSLMIPGTGWEEESKRDPNFEKKIGLTHPLGRLGSAEEVANAITFLCSEKAGFVNGACLVVDGGESRSF